MIQTFVILNTVWNRERPYETETCNVISCFCKASRCRICDLCTGSDQRDRLRIECAKELGHFVRITGAVVGYDPGDHIGGKIEQGHHPAYAKYVESQVGNCCTTGRDVGRNSRDISGNSCSNVFSQYHSSLPFQKESIPAYT